MKKLELGKIARILSRGSIRRRLLAWGLSLLGVALIGNTLAGSIFTRRLIKEEAAELQKEIATRVALEIEDFMRRKVERLLDLSASATLYELGGKEQRLLVLLLLKNDRAFTAASILDGSGMELLKLSERRVYLPVELADQSDAGKYKKAIKGENYISPVYTSDKAEPYVTIAVPLRVTPQEIIGVLSVEANLRILWEVIGEIEFGRAGYAYLVDSRGNLIAHRDPSLVLKRTSLSGLHQVQEFLRNPLKSDPSPGGEDLGIMGNAVLSTFAPVRSLGWAVVLEEPVKAALARAWDVERFALILLGMGLVVGALIIMWVSSRITEPIRKLHQGVEVIGRGNLSHRVEIKTGDEIEQLAQEFNKMAGELQSSYSSLEQKVEQRTKEIATLYDVTAAVNRSLEPDLFLREVMRKILAVTPFAAARIYLLDSDGKELRLRAWEGISADFAAQTATDAVGTGINGHVAATGAPAVFGDIQTDPKYAELAKGQIARKSGFHAYISIAIKAKEKVIGVINFLSHKPHEFLARDIDLFTSMANQIGVALENASLFDQVRTRSQQLAALNTIAATVNRSLDPDVVLKESAGKVCDLLGFDAAWIYVIDPSGQELHLRGYKGLSDEVVRDIYKRGLGKGSMGRVIESGAPLVYENIQADPGYLKVSAGRRAQSIGFHQLCNFPVKSKGRTLGVLNLANYSQGRFLPEQLELIGAIANEIGVGLENAQLFTEIKNKTTELEKANFDLVEANRAKADFLAAMSHELRTPLNVIIGNADLIKDGTFGDVSEKQKGAVRKILHYSDTLLKLINDVLTLTKVEARKMSLNLSTFRVGEIIVHAQSYVEQLNRNGRLKVLWQVQRDLPSMTTDALKLEEILQNLIGNAFKFTSQGSIEIRVRDLHESRRIEFAVADTGMGIAAGDLDRIFEQFHQLKEAHTGAYSGVGLGLSIVKRYLEMMQGEIRVESRPGQGSAFTFELPYSIQQIAK